MTRESFDGGGAHICRGTRISTPVPTRFPSLARGVQSRAGEDVFDVPVRAERMPLCEQIFFDRVLVSSREVTYGEAQETCGGIAFVSEKACPTKAPHRCQTPGASQAAHRHKAPYKCEKAVGCEAANVSKAFKRFQAKSEFFACKRRHHAGRQPAIRDRLAALPSRGPGATVTRASSKTVAPSNVVNSELTFVGVVPVLATVTLPNTR
jgi:hypothetical protein